MIRVKITTDTRYPVNRKVIRQATIDTFKRENLESIDAEISVAVVGKRKMKALSSKYLSEGQVHEVLAFALEETGLEADRGFINPPGEALQLGDVVLVDDEVYFLTSHGLLHLLGKHHE